MLVDVREIELPHPGIVQLFSIGESAQGRDLIAAKVSDNVATDEAEPEAYIDGLTHGNEPMSLEMTIRLLRWLAEGYGTDARITDRRPDRGLDRVRRQPRRTGLRLRLGLLPQLAQEPAAERRHHGDRH